MKIFRLVPIISMAILPLTTIPFSSCSNLPKLTEQEQYISDRTFSIAATAGNKIVFGTGWIISDATKENANDYCYWLATNWHVIHGFETELYGSITYKYADRTYGNMSINNYSNFFKFEIEDPSQFVYELPVGTQFIPSIDLYVAKVNFGSPKNSIKSKLDKLNKFQVDNGYINLFASDDQETWNKTKIVGGYPYSKANSVCNWESHTFASTDLQYTAKGQTKKIKSEGGSYNVGHSIGDPYYDQFGYPLDGSEDFYNWDISPQYSSRSAKNTDFMEGGASGSMLLTEDYKVCGIYWGGWLSNNKYYPSFSVFKSSDIDFLQPYI